MPCGKIYIDMNDNLNLNENYDKDFEFAYGLCEKELSHNTLIHMLVNGNIAEKQISALKLDCINNEYEAHVLLSNLTGCDGKIREAVALKINSLMQDYSVQQIFSPISARVFADATIDINANICRLITEASNLLKWNKDFSSQYAKYIVEYVEDALAEIDKFVYKDKKYVINKQLFKLYWCLEALYKFYEFVDTDKLQSILEHSLKVDEYTIKEKVAKIVTNTKQFSFIREQLNKDDNYYVKQILNHPSVFEEI